METNVEYDFTKHSGTEMHARRTVLFYLKKLGVSRRTFPNKATSKSGLKLLQLFNINGLRCPF